MRVSGLRAYKFKRFENLTISGLGPDVRLVVVSGANGSGKSGILEALNQFRRMHRWGSSGATDYFYKKSADGQTGVGGAQQVSVSFHGDALSSDIITQRMWIRPAFRHQTEFDVSSIQRQPSPSDDPGLDRLILPDSLVSGNYSRLMTSSVANLFNASNRGVAAGVLVDQLIGELQRGLADVFGDLQLDNLTDPLGEGTFFFSKGTSQHFSFANLSAGERAAFDILLDLIVRREVVPDLLYGIDEPELHLGSAVQGRLLDTLLRLLPGATSQLWIATHSLGMLKRAVELHQANPSQVAFIDTFDQDFDQATELQPRYPTRGFWRESLKVALDDMASLVAPEHVVLCEGQEIEDGFDATCYRSIFRETHPGVEFLSTGNSFEVKSDRQGVAAAIQVLAPGTKVTKLIDRDDQSVEEVETLKLEGTRVLSMRNIESFLLADEVICKLYAVHERPEADAIAAIAEKASQLQTAVEHRGKARDDLKPIAPNMRAFLSRDLGIAGSGSTFMAFAKTQLVPLITSETTVFRTLSNDIFG